MSDVIVSPASAELGNQFWQYVLRVPREDNPLLDQEGWFANVNQSGEIFFLAGVINESGTAEREITIREGQSLVFPILNSFSPDPVPLTSEDDQPDNLEELRNIANGINAGTLGNTEGLSLTIDLNGDGGQPEVDLDNDDLKNDFRQDANVDTRFRFFLPENNVLELFTDPSSNIPEQDFPQEFFPEEPGVKNGIVQGGFYAQVDDLPVGTHTLEFSGTFNRGTPDPGDDFTLRITYTINVEDFNEILGDDSSNTLFGTNGNDDIDAFGGNDIVYSNEGKNIIDGWEGDDQLYGGNSDDTIYGGLGDDTIYGNEGHNVLSGGEGDDLIYGGNQADTLLGGAGDDTIYANSGVNLINSGSGQDTVWVGGTSTVVLNTDDVFNSVEDFDTVKNFVLGQTTFKVSSLNRDDFTFGNSAGGAQISQNGDLLAVVSWQSASTFENNFADIFVM